MNSEEQNKLHERWLDGDLEALIKLVEAQCDMDTATAVATLLRNKYDGTQKQMAKDSIIRQQAFAFRMAYAGSQSKEPYPILHKIAEAWGEDLKTVERRYERGLFD